MKPPKKDRCAPGRERVSESSHACERLSRVENLLKFGVQAVGELLDDTAGNSFSFGGRRWPYGPSDSEGYPGRSEPFGALWHGSLAPPNTKRHDGDVGPDRDEGRACEQWLNDRAGLTRTLGEKHDGLAGGQYLFANSERFTVRAPRRTGKPPSELKSLATHGFRHISSFPMKRTRRGDTYPANKVSM